MYLCATHKYISKINKKNNDKTIYIHQLEHNLFTIEQLNVTLSRNKKYKVNEYINKLKRINLKNKVYNFKSLKY